MHAIRSARPKLSLAVPVAAVQATRPVIPTLIIPGAASSAATSRPAVLPSPLTPTARNTALNARPLHSSSLQVPALAGKSAKKHAAKSVRFAEEEHVTLVSPCPREYYGEYVAMTREERRWARE
jgi:hypothetical protein